MLFASALIIIYTYIVLMHILVHGNKLQAGSHDISVCIATAWMVSHSMWLCVHSYSNIAQQNILCTGVHV